MTKGAAELFKSIYWTVSYEMVMIEPKISKANMLAFNVFLFL